MNSSNLTPSLPPDRPRPCDDCSCPLGICRRSEAAYQQQQLHYQALQQGGIDLYDTKGDYALTEYYSE
ncbi:hypothetical protein [Telluribacter humicola]|uniref:hypothetical protein n=1 Tax=Telluribacter humicola TaxID=1720261 RepID=UPI001A9755F3|nr:hypothetical protein [Telluribacter humicola]